METITATSLDDLAELDVEVEISRPDGRIVRVPMRALSEQESFDLRQTITWPTPPESGFAKPNGGTPRPVYNYDDPGYLKAQREANRKLSYLVMLHCLRLDIPGETEDERLATLQGRLGNYAYMQLITASNKLNLVTEGDLAALAHSFRAAGTAGAKIVDQAADGPEPVVQPQ